MSSVVSWIPIGYFWSSTEADPVPFRGTFDGGSHTIKNIVIRRYDQVYASLFRQTMGATIKDLKVSASISARSYCGGIARKASDTVILGCQVSRTVKAASTAGGIVGEGYAAVVDYDYETFFSGNPGYAESLALQRDTPKEVILPFVPQIDSDGAVYGKDPSDRFLNDPQMTAETTGFSSMGRIRTMYWPVEMRQFLPIINTVRTVRIPGLRMESTMRCTGTE